MNLSEPTWRGRRGFTLTELLVVVLVLFLLLIFALPFYDRPKPGQAVRCLNNLKQMNLAWIMYASDSEDMMVTNRPYAGSAELPLDNWVAGVVDWTTNSQNTNQALLLAAALSPYLKSAQVYRCPEDRSESAVGPRVRSYSMNGFLGNYGGKPNFPGWKSALKLPYVSSPTSTFLFAEEHANSIDDGFFINDPNRINAWMDLPAANHANGSAGFGFADGHSEIHKWTEASTRQAVKPSGPKPTVQLKQPDVGNDLAWVLKSMGAVSADAASEPAK